VAAPDQAMTQVGEGVATGVPSGWGDDLPSGGIGEGPDGCSMEEGKVGLGLG
jgi:hypothetical protein